MSCLSGICSLLCGSSKQKNHLNDFPNELTINILSYLKEDLQSVDSVNHHFRPLIEERCNREYRPLKLPPGISPKQWIFKFPQAMGIDFIQRTIGAVDNENLPIPKNYVDRPRRGFNLALMPSRISIEVDENSSIELEKTRLVVNPDRGPPTGKTKTVIAQRTLRNVVFIFQHCLKEQFFFKFDGLFDCTWDDILDQHGDVDPGPTHWAYQQSGFAPGRSPRSQSRRAGKGGLEIAPLVDAVFFDLLTYVQTGKIPQRDYIQRTSTITLDNSGTPYQSTVQWRTSGPHFRLYLSYLGDDEESAVAVRVPAQAR